MPRNSSGNYSLPSASFSPQTTISSAAMNLDLSDIAVALTGSIASNGSTPITGALQGVSGTVSNPGFTFISSTNTGIYLSGANQLGTAAGGVQVATFNSSGAVNFNGAINNANSV